ncbi:MAG: hypothetical protein G8D58_09200 [gamma proteobacterium symbiont of Phacoides pectinatus]
MAKKIGDWATKLGLQPLPTMAPTAQRFWVLIDRVSGTNSAYKCVATS